MCNFFLQEGFMKTAFEKDLATVQRCVGTSEDYKGCGKNLVLGIDDIFISTFPQADCEEEQVLRYTFRCPHCGVFTHIPQWNLPRMVRREAMQKYFSRTVSNNEAV